MPIAMPEDIPQTLLQNHLSQINITPLIIVSDGSWKNTGDIQQQVFEINPAHRAGAAVGIINSTHKKANNLVLNITSLTRTASKLSVTTEMIAAYLAILVHNHQPKPLQKNQITHTDCIAVQKLYNVWSPHTRAGSKFFPIIAHAAKMKKNIQWIKSHREKIHRHIECNSLEWE